MMSARREIHAAGSGPDGTGDRRPRATRGGRGSRISAAVAFEVVAPGLIPASGG
jgi:hypothetical protein